MMNIVGSIVGCLLIFAICAWAVFAMAFRLRSQIETGKAVDRTLSEVDKEDAPNMYWLQVLGFVLWIGVSALIGIGAIVVLFQGLMSD